MAPEAKVKKQIKQFLDAQREAGQPVWYYMPVQNGMGVTGIPDFIICWHGRMVAIETKAPGKIKNVSANQQRQLLGIVKAAGRAIVVDNVDAAVDFLKEVTSLRSCHSVDI